MSKIINITAREILSSGSSPTIEARVELESGVVGEASVPFGASAGSHEAAVLVDKNPQRYHGKGMLKAVENVSTTISMALVGQEASNHRQIDETMLKLDGTPNKANLGGNSILAVSLAVARAQANEENLPLYAYIRKAFSIPLTDYVLPNPMVVVIEGGKHADETTDLQEYIISTYGKPSAAENVRMGIEIYDELKSILKKAGLSTNVGNEGAFAPSGIKSNAAPLEFIMEAIKKSSYVPGQDVGISIDAAATEFFKADTGKYHLKLENRDFTGPELIEFYSEWFHKFPIVTIEDMLHEDDWENWPRLTQKASANKIVNIGDDLLVTNKARVEKAIALKAVTGVLIKLNQAGSLTETVDTCLAARQAGYLLATSHRGGGETNDAAMVDLAVAMNAEFIKVGPTRGERVSKYNRLMEIERELNGSSRVTGSDFRK
ncbi:MAG: phosphopyruvate hydratase [bacterium]|nr:phosphopyruvate hydratase [bacterium]